MTTTDYKGLYIHVPFCRSKCPYCDFYSFVPDSGMVDKYVAETERRLKNTRFVFDTVYFGGGTPDLLGAENISRLLGCINHTADAEITVECNPYDTGRENCDFDFGTLTACGVNRISMGLQSAIDSERKALGRRSGKDEIITAVSRFRNAGIDNISLDVMLGIPGQTAESLSETLKFCAESGAKHISAYILKIEDGTYFGKNKDNLDLPDDDAVSDYYLFTVDFLENHGFKQYEISNFALPGFESRHNLKYWHCGEYLGIGPAAHSFIDGERFYFDRNIDAYLTGCSPVSDGKGGDKEEYAMLALRLKEGLDEKKMIKRFGSGFSAELKSYALELQKRGLASFCGNRINLTPEGFLVSNIAISEIISKL